MINVVLYPEIYDCLACGAEYFSAPLGDYPAEEFSAEMTDGLRKFQALLIPYSVSEEEIFYKVLR